MPIEDLGKTNISFGALNPFSLFDLSYFESDLQNIKGGCQI